MRLNNKSNK